VWTARRQEGAGYRRAGPAVHSLLGGAAGRRAGRGGGPEQLRPRPQPHRTDRQTPRPPAPHPRARRQQAGGHRGRGQGPRRALGRGPRHRPRRRLRPGGRPRRELPDRRVALRGHRRPDLGLLPQGPDRRPLPPHAAGRLRRRPGLRRPGRLAGLRLDGRGQGRPRVDLALPRPRPRRKGHQGEPRLRRPRKNPRRQGHQRLRRDRGRVGPTGAARVGDHRPRAGGPGRRKPALGLVAGDDRRADPRRRRLPRDGGPDQV
ncbi:MAG: Enoyl-[acyl-carrier-protein] reductase [NADH], partial [uncultured Rubrobacteraceae bacterium]